MIKQREKLFSSELKRHMQDKATKGESIVCRVLFSDFSKQLYNDSEINFLFSRRKIDPYWKDVQFIQIYIPAKGNVYKTFYTEFKREEVCNNEMYNRAQREVEIIIGKIPKSSKSYVSREEEILYEETLKSKCKYQFSLYFCCKIFLLLEYTNGLRVDFSKCEFIESENGIFFIDCPELLFAEIPNFIPFSNAMPEHQSKFDMILFQLGEKQKDKEKKEMYKAISSKMKFDLNKASHVKMVLPSELEQNAVYKKRVYYSLYPDAKYSIDELNEECLSMQKTKDLIFNGFNKNSIYSEKEKIKLKRNYFTQKL